MISHMSANDSWPEGEQEPLLEADFVIVGFGAAGAAAALRAAELGASVLVVEKQPADAHTPSTYMSGGHIMGVNDVERATEYLDRCSAGMVPRSVSEAWAQKALDIIEWLEQHGIDRAYRRAYGAEHLEIVGAEGIDVFMSARRCDGTLVDFGAQDGSSGQAQGVAPMVDPALGTGRELWPAMRVAVESQANVNVLWQAPAERLVQDQTRRVVGVRVLLDGALRMVRARHGVLLSCGGYEFDDDLKLGFLKAAPIHFYGNPGNTGDGVRLAQSAGASLWHMNQMIGRAIAHFEDEDGNPLNLPFGPSIGRTGGYVITDRHGRRFFNEHRQAEVRHDVYYELLDFDPERGEHPRIPCYWFFDAKRIATTLAPTNMGATGVGMYEWSEDNRREIERGWIAEADSVEEAARLAGVADPVAAAASVAGYNAACASGEDEFGRPPESLAPLDRPPYYCVPLYPGGSNTSGGPRRDERARVLDPYGRPIAGLYCAGELGQAIGLLYPAGGCNISDAIAFGRIAAEDALRPDAETAPTSRIGAGD